MPVTKIPDRLVTISKLISDQWVPGNARNLTPEISTGWFDQSKSLPYISVTTPDELTARRGLNSDGVVQDMEGFVIVACWADRNVLDPDNADAPLGHAGVKAFVYEMWQEVDRIITEGAQSTAVVTVGGLDFIELSTGTRIPDDSTKPPTFRWQGNVSYAWVKLPG